MSEHILRVVFHLPCRQLEGLGGIPVKVWVYNLLIGWAVTPTLGT